MERRVPLCCRCGTVRGHADITPRDGTRILCYCADCQAFARYLDRDDILDRHGGTDIFQCSPARITLTDGTSELRCLRLSPTGMHRFYASCCSTPVGNTFGGKLPFVGVPCTFMELLTEGESRDIVLGPPTHYQFGRSARGNVPRHVSRTFAPLPMLRTLRLIGRWWVTARGQPSPYFDPAHAPRAPVHVLTREERLVLRRAPEPT